MRKTKAEIHAQAMADFDAAWSVAAPERAICLEDRRFASIPGAQWEGGLGDQFANRPKFEINKVLQAVTRVVSDYRNNRISVSFVAKDGATDDDMADTCAGLYRADEQDSSALEAYDNAFEEAVSGGFGGFRFCADYEDDGDEENDRQRIEIEPIFDADQVLFFDPAARRKDKADARWAILLTPMARDVFKEEYGEEGTDFQRVAGKVGFTWVTPDVVYIGEYYVKENVAENCRVFQDLQGNEFKHSETELENDPQILADYAAVGTKEVRTRKIKREKVHKYILSGNKVIEDCGFIAGEHIPLVPVYGKRWFIEGIEHCMGVVRPAKDAQRISNMQLSKLGELSAMSAVEKPIFTPEQVAGHEGAWAKDAVENFPFALINPTMDANGNQVPQGPLGYTKPPSIPPAMAALLQIADTGLQDILGLNQQGDEMQSNISGKAVELIQTRQDVPHFLYMSNMADAVRRGGEIWLSMAREVYVEPGRKMKTIGNHGEASQVVLGEPILGNDGEVKQRGALADAKFDVAVDVGPSSTSRKAATVRSLIGMMQITQDPQSAAVLGAVAMMNMEGEGIASVKEHFRKRLVGMGVEKPTEQDLKEQQGQQPAQPDANQVYLQAAATEAQAKAEKAKADTEYALAKTQEAKANTLDTLAGIDMAHRQQVLDTAKQLDAAMRDRQPAPPQVGENRIPQ